MEREIRGGDVVMGRLREIDIPLLSPPLAEVPEPVAIDSRWVHFEVAGELHLCECWFICEPDGMYRITVDGEMELWVRDACLVCRHWLEISGNAVPLADALRANLEVPQNEENQTEGATR